jgi:signal transduction histidine kinase/CheY-like chemotaxis protein
VAQALVILAPSGRDSTVIQGILRSAGMKSSIEGSLAGVIDTLDAARAGAAILAEEALSGDGLKLIETWLEHQPPWSDLPLILLTKGRGGPETKMELASRLGNVTILERPLHPVTLVSAARAALRARARQHIAERHVADLEKSQRSLAESEAKYRTLFSSMDEGFCIIEFRDGPEGPLSDYVHVEANDAYARHAGIADVVGQNVRDMVPDEAQEWIRIYREVLKTGTPIRFERELVATGRYLELAAFRIEPPEKRQVAVLFQDVTSRRSAEIALHELNLTLEGRVDEAVAENLRDQKKLAEATERMHEMAKLETLGQLTGGVAHDFNNLLTPIVGSLDMLRRRHEGDERSNKLISSAMQASQRAVTLVQRLLSFARRQHLETRTVDISKLVDGTHDLIQRTIGPHIRVNIETAEDLPPARIDPGQLELAILNLAVNARDAMVGGGTLTLRLDEVHLDEATEDLSAGRYIRLTVADTGVGMDEQTLSRAVEPFFTTKGQGEGTGLGLSMIHGLAAQSGGALQIESAVGKGTTAKIWLPAADGEADHLGDREEMLSTQPRSAAILLVDDEELVRFATAEMLRDLGHKVTAVESGAAAIAHVLSGEEVDLVITDYLMPGMRGSELIEGLRRHRPDLPALLLTGYANLSKGEALGIPRLSKPFREADLAREVAELLRRDTVAERRERIKSVT